MHFIDLIHLLHDELDIEHVFRGTNPHVQTVLRCDQEKRAEWKPGALFIGGPLDIPQLDPEVPIMLISSGQLPNLPAGSEVARVDPSLYDEVECIIREMIQIEIEAKSTLFSLAGQALEGKSIVTLMNAAASYVGNALILVNTSQKILSYSTNFDFEDSLWLENVEKGYYSHDFKQKVRSNPVMRKWNKFDGGTRVVTL